MGVLGPIEAARFDPIRQDFEVPLEKGQTWEVSLAQGTIDEWGVRMDGKVVLDVLDVRVTAYIELGFGDFEWLSP